RKNKTAKKFANRLFSSAASVCDRWDRGVLRGATSERMHGVADDGFAEDAALLQPSMPASRRLAAELRAAFGLPGLEFTVAKYGRLNECDRVSVGDAAVLWDAGGG
ncbi:unnamed protein product, partial [Prorocentrum cordatum]